MSVLQLSHVLGLKFWTLYVGSLYVLLCHTYTTARPVTDSIGAGFLAPLSLLAFGHDAVVVFIVLSGYCLMLPVVRSQSFQLRGGFRLFIARRVRRIVPPYYAALLLFAFSPFLLKTLLGKSPPFAPYHTTWGDFLAHLFLIHNWRVSWARSIDFPMWSVSAEWQIYFLFALLLLPTWRKFGKIGSFVLSIVVAFIPMALRAAGIAVDWSCPWFLSMFCLGMLAAHFSFSTFYQNWSAVKVPILTLALIFFCIACALHGFAPEQDATPWIDAPIGLATSFFLLSVTQVEAGTTAKRIRKVLESRWVVAIGAFSYSLYLIHWPIICTLHEFLTRKRLPGWQYAVGLYGGSIGLSLRIGYVFYLLFERPFTQPTRPKSIENTQAVIVVAT